MCVCMCVYESTLLAARPTSDHVAVVRRPSPRVNTNVDAYTHKTSSRSRLHAPHTNREVVESVHLHSNKHKRTQPAPCRRRTTSISRIKQTTTKHHPHRRRPCSTSSRTNISIYAAAFNTCTNIYRERKKEIWIYQDTHIHTDVAASLRPDIFTSYQ